MGYADADGKHAASEDEGFRASFLRKRHSLFGRPESMSSSHDLHSTPVKSIPQAPHVRGVLFHHLSEREVADEPKPKSKEPKEPVENRRRSFFGFKFGKKEELHPKRDLPPVKSEQSPESLVSSTAQHTNIDNEDEYYRNHTKQSISTPFNFQHVTHTRKKHLPALDTVDERDLKKEFWKASIYQGSRHQFKDISGQEVPGKIDDIEVHQGAEVSRPVSPEVSRPVSPEASRPVSYEVSKFVSPETSRPVSPIEMQPPPPIIDHPARSSKENITALPGISKPSRAPSKRSELGSLLGLRDKAESYSSDQTQASMKARTDTWNALLGVSEAPLDTKPSNEDIAGLLGISVKPEKAAKKDEKSREDSKRFSGAFRIKTSDSNSSKKDGSSLLGFKERSMSETSLSSSKSKRNEVNALLGLPETTKRHSKHVEPEKKEKIDALLGIPKRSTKKFEPMAPPAPPRPRRSDEEMRAADIPAPSPHMPPPDRPRRDSKDVQYLREMGFGQLLYRENSNESRYGQSLRREISNESRQTVSMQRQGSADSRQSQAVYDSRHTSPMLRQGSTESRQSQAIYDSRHTSPTIPQYSNHTSPTIPQYSNHSPNTSISQQYPYRRPSEEVPHPGVVAEDTSRAQQVHYRSRQPLPALPRPNNISPEARSPLQTVNEVGEVYSPMRTPTDSAISPRSLNSPYSAGRTIRSPELTGPSMPDDETWEHEIDYLYSKEAEADNEFDWDNVSMTPQRLSTRDVDKRLSLNIPSDSAPHRLSNKLSEGSLRSSIYLPAALNISQPQATHRYSQPARKPMSPVDEFSRAGARASPEVRVMDVDEHQRQGLPYVGPLQMHGYESIAAGYLSDPETNSEQSQHRKSNSYSSWESRPLAIKEQVRYSNASLGSVPDLTQTRRQPKLPITHIPGYQDHPANEYAAFSRGPYAQELDHVASRRPEHVNHIASLRAAPAGRVMKDTRAETHRWSRPIQPQQSNPYEQSSSGWI